jgi:transcriptional regulator with PAS, ATPase and Fis domain
MESELFGHEKGSFTGANERRVGKFQLANNGTLFLDEIAELKPEMQVKLLRVLQEKKFVPVGGNREVKINTRIIAATNQNLEKMMEDGAFREDLFYRLNVMPLFLPPLRDRKEDLPLLANHFIAKHSKTHSSKITSISAQAMKCLVEYRWPGNIRELENTIERAFIVETGSQIEVQSLPDHIKNSPLEDKSDKEKELNFETFKETSEKEFIISALKANKGKINQTVAHANIPKNTLLRKIRKYQIDPEDYK